MSKDETKLLSVKQAAAALGVNRQRVQQLIDSKRLPAEKVGAFYVIREIDLELVRERKAGRPPKAKTETSKASKKGGKK
jgi:excisionase family DNA binding protein